MAVLYSNNASSTLSASITSTATSLSVASGAGALFPAPSGSDYFYITLVNSAGAMEIMKVTARSADTLTVVRGQDGTTGVAWAAGDRVELRFTRAMLDDIKGERMPAYGPSAGSGGRVMINLSGNPAWSDINFTYDPIMGQFRAIGLRANMGDSAPTWNFNNILHAGNYSSYALPLGGGTLTGSLHLNVSDGLKVTYDGTDGDTWYRGWGVESNRATTYFRPVNNSTQTLRIGYSEGSQSWDGVRVDATVFTHNGHTVLNSNNYSSFAATSSHGHIRLNSSDTRTISPSSHSNGAVTAGFTSWANNNTGNWADYLHFRSYTDGSGGNDNLVMFNKGSIGMRIWQQSFGSGAAYSSYVDVLHSGNYTNYTGQYVLKSGDTMTGTLQFNSLSNSVIAQHDGTGAYWRGRIISRNSDANRAVFLGNYNSKAGLFAHTNALDGWAPLYLNTLGDNGGSTVYLPHNATYTLDSANNAYAVLTTANYGDYADNRYVRLITGDSGSYGLNVSGQHAWVRFSKGTWGDSNPNVGNWSHVLSFNAAPDDNRTFQIYGGDVPGAMYVRRSQGGSGAWHSWERVLTSYNWSDYAAPASHTHNYVLKTGDTMTGHLTMTGGASVRVFFDGSSSITSQLYFANNNNNRAWNWQLDENNNAALWGFNGSTWAKKITATQDGYLLAGGKYQADGWVHSDRDFVDGTLIQTDIAYNVTNGDPFVLEIRGNSYGSQVPFDIQYQGYIYSDTIINHGGYSNGTNITGLVAINYNGNLCFWFPRQAYWQGFYVRAFSAYASYPRQRVFSISNSAKPTTAKQVDLSANIRQSLNTGNYNSYSPTLTGGGASGTWSINVTGSATSVGGYSSDGWLRKVSDASQFQIYGNSRSIVFRTDGTTNPHGGGAYPYIWFYGGSADADRRMIMNTSGQLWLSNYGWLHDAFAGASHTHNYMSADYSRPGGDLNSKLIPGNYGISYTESNRPADWGALIVGRSSDVVAQWYLDHNNAFWIRGGNPPAAGGGGVWNSWREVLHSGNYTNYAAPISHTHNYVLKTGDTMTGRLTIDGSGWTTNNRNYSNEWIEFGNYSGLYSPNNGAHFYPNNGSYGSWRSAGSRNGWAGIEFDASNGQMVLMIDPASNTSGFHNNSYGWQFRWNNGTAYVYKNAYGGGTAATVLDSSNYSNYALPIGGGWYGTGLPGSRWGGYSVNGGEISFGRDLPNTGQMGILVDGCYVAGENNGFWSMGSDNTWGSRRGMYWDGTYLRFDLGSPVSKMYALTVGNWDFYENSGGWNANIIAAGIYHGRVRVKASSYNSSGDQETYMWVDNTVTPSTGMYSTKNLFNFNGSITTVQVAGNTVLTGGNFTNYVPYGYPGWPGYPGTDANSFHSGSWLRSSFTYSNNAPHTGTIVHFPSSGYDLQLNGSYGGTSLSFRNRNGDNGTWNAWNTVLHSGNYTSYGDTKYLRGDGTTPVTPNNLNFGIGRYFGYTYIQTFNSEALQLNPIGNAVYINGNVAIHAGNISSYAGADTGAKGNIQIFNASGTFTVPAGITKLRITAFGGGGGGATQYAWTGGSGGCGIAIVTVTPGSSYTVTVGAGGRGAGWAGGAQAGGTTSFGSLVTATGGLGSVWNTVPPTSGTFTTTGTLIASSKLSGNNLSLMGGADGGTNYSYVAGGGGGMHGGGGAAGSTGGNSMYGAKGNNGTGNGAGTGGAGGSASGGAAGGAGGTYGSDGYTTAYGGGGGGAGGVIVEW